jgi:phenylacetate-CoA ligase
MVRVKESEFYDAAKEAMPANERKRFLNGQLREIVNYAYHNAPAVKEKMDRVGVAPSQIITVRDLEKIPITSKDVFSELQKLSPPFGGFLGVPQTKEIFVSPGPIYEPEIPECQFDAAAKALYATGCRKGDTVIVTVSFHMVPAGAHFAGAAKKLGITMIPTGVGNTELQLQIMRDLKVTAYAGTPSFLMTLIKRAEELGYNFRQDFELRHALLGAEMLPESLRRTFEQDYGIRTQQIYSTAELLLLGYECSQKSGWHIPEEVLIEIVDHTTGKQLAPGEVGEIVVTPFNKIFPLIRYGTGDLSSIIAEPCPCGRTSPRLTGLLGRVGEEVKVRAMFVHPRQVKEVMAKFNQIAQFQVKVGRHKQRDVITISLELKDESIDKQKLTNDLANAFQDICRVKADKIEFVTKGTIPEEYKVIVDERIWE